MGHSECDSMPSILVPTVWVIRTSAQRTKLHLETLGFSRSRSRSLSACSSSPWASACSTARRAASSRIRPVRACLTQTSLRRVQDARGDLALKVRGAKALQREIHCAPQRRRLSFDLALLRADRPRHRCRRPLQRGRRIVQTSRDSIQGIPLRLDRAVAQGLLLHEEEVAARRSLGLARLRLRPTSVQAGADAGQKAGAPSGRSLPQL